MSNRKEQIIRVAVWLILFLSPITFFNHGTGVNLVFYLMACMSPVLLLVVFYANYLWLAPRYFVEGEKRCFWLVNTVLCVGLGIVLHFWIIFTHEMFVPDAVPAQEPTNFEHLLFTLRDIFNMAVSATIATTIHLSMRLTKAEEARREAEASRAEAELLTLRNQLNPHFLLNTLNNIYALTAIDAAKAQEAIEQLSRLLRHMLYEDQESLTLLEGEVTFLENYVNLMKIRLAGDVDVSLRTDIRQSGLQLLPMLFISLVENAFKHGISPTEPSFIHILIGGDDHSIVCDITNSNHPKPRQDCSGHGIGLQQVQRRLDLVYPGCYTWEKGVSADGRTYHSRITIHWRARHSPTASRIPLSSFVIPFLSFSVSHFSFLT